jgi:hypothetical protein
MTPEQVTPLCCPGCKEELHSQPTRDQVVYHACGVVSQRRDPDRMTIIDRRKAT